VTNTHDQYHTAQNVENATLNPHRPHNRHQLKTRLSQLSTSTVQESIETYWHCVSCTYNLQQKETSPRSPPCCMRLSNPRLATPSILAAIFWTLHSRPRGWSLRGALHLRAWVQHRRTALVQHRRRDGGRWRRWLLGDDSLVCRRAHRRHHVRRRDPVHCVAR
jgi:hypothetical protein